MEATARTYVLHPGKSGQSQSPTRRSRKSGAVLFQALRQLDADDRIGRADALYCLGEFCQIRGDLAKAEECYQRASQSGRRSGTGRAWRHRSPLLLPFISSPGQQNK